MPAARPKRGPSKPSPTAYTSSAILKSTSIITRPTTNLQAFLLTCLNSWSEYTEPQKHQIINSLPTAYQIRNTDSEGNLICPLSMDFIREDLYVREGIEKFKRDVSEGYFDPAWRQNAAIAMRERAEGKFDDYIREKVENEFGDLPVEDAQEQEQESSESDREWRKTKGQGARKGKGKGKGNGRPRGVTARGEMQSAMEMDD
jgi:hypothetical protein